MIRAGSRPSLGRIDPLAYYTPELAGPADGWGALQELSARARRASEQLAAEGRQARSVRSVLVPEEGTCFHVYEATSADEVRTAASRARLASAGLLDAVITAAETRDEDARAVLSASTQRGAVIQSKREER